jgi:hypothetical protein
VINPVRGHVVAPSVRSALQVGVSSNGYSGTILRSWIKNPALPIVSSTNVSTNWKFLIPPARFDRPATR